MQHGLSWIPNGAAGTDATLKAIGRLATGSQQRPVIRIAAISILDQANINTRDTYQVVKTLWSWTRRFVRYLRDPIGVETVQSPEITLQLKAGDCDDHAALMGAFGLNLGIPVRFVTVGTTADRQSHIFPEFQINGKWIAADTTSQREFGYRPRLSVEKHYTTEGRPMPLLSGPALMVPLKKGELQRQIYAAAYNQMRLNFSTGMINRADVASYLRVIREGNQPAQIRGTLAETPVTQAITDFLQLIDSTGAQSSKPVGALNGLEGLDGFLSSIVKAVGGVVKGAIKLVTGGGSDKQVIVQPTINIPAGAVQTTVTPQAAQAGVMEFLSNPIVLVGGALAIILLMRR
jgi:hypothetical protein